jgi:hypothetical protein
VNGASPAPLLSVIAPHIRHTYKFIDMQIILG